MFLYALLTATELGFRSNFLQGPNKSYLGFHIIRHTINSHRIGNIGYTVSRQISNKINHNINSMYLKISILFIATVINKESYNNKKETDCRIWSEQCTLDNNGRTKGIKFIRKNYRSIVLCLAGLGRRCLQEEWRHNSVPPSMEHCHHDQWQCGIFHPEL